MRSVRRQGAGRHPPPVGPGYRVTMTEQTQPARPAAIPASPSLGLPSTLGLRSVLSVVGRHPDVLGLLAVLLLTALTAWHRLSLENGLAHLDIPTFYLPWYAHLGETIRALDLSLIHI